MIIMPRFVQSAEMAKASGSPKLTRPLEASLALIALGFNRPTANGPASISQFLVIHSALLLGEIIPFPAHDFPSLTTRHFELGDLFQHRLLLPMTQLMQSLLDPGLGLGLLDTVSPA
jgi:hypothetical protein